MNSISKIIHAVIIALAFSVTSYGQLSFIPKAGVSLASVSYGDAMNVPGNLDFGSKTGVVVGVGVEIPLGKRISIQSDLLFHQKGYTEKYTDDVGVQDYKFTLNYLEVPIMARVNFGRFYGTAGPYVAAGVGGNYSGSYSFTGSAQPHDGKIRFGEPPYNYGGTNHYVHQVDAGLVAGAGVKLGPIVIDVRYGLGLKGLYDKDNFISPVKNRSLQLTVGFPLKMKA